MLSRSENIFRYTAGDLEYSSGDTLILSIVHPSLGSYEKELAIPPGDTINLEPYQDEYQDWLSNTREYYKFYFKYDYPEYDRGSLFMEQYSEYDGTPVKTRRMESHNSLGFWFRIDQHDKYTLESPYQEFDWFRFINSAANITSQEGLAEGSQVLTNGVMYSEVSNIPW